MRIDSDRAIEVIQAALEFDWSWTVADLPAFAERVGWHLEDPEQNGPSSPPTSTLTAPTPRCISITSEGHECRGLCGGSGSTAATSSSTTRVRRHCSTARSTNSPSECSNSWGSDRPGGRSANRTAVWDGTWRKFSWNWPPAASLSVSGSSVLRIKRGRTRSTGGSIRNSLPTSTLSGDRTECPSCDERRPHACRPQMATAS
ncbi:DUF6301 family protein [Nocardia sp. NPDC101769]|uniref:DUF6301 family protein n=1 Tax=Nocardia sp. NPDC101769 TaxID=3364333 RepID=UPI0037F94127